MSHGQRPSGYASPTVTRRRLLGGVCWAAVGLSAGISSGCTASDPLIDPGSPPPSGGLRPSARATPPRGSPSATTSLRSTQTTEPQPATAEALRREQALAAVAAAILVGPHRGDLSDAQRRTLASVRDGHRAHVAALSSAEPTTRPRAPLPAGRAGRPPDRATSLAASLRGLAAQERRQSARLARSAVDAVGYGALLLASMSVAADAYADAVSGGSGSINAPSTGPHTAMPSLSDLAALQSVVRQLHAVIYGYQLALGRLSAFTPKGRRALRTLAARRRLRDRLVESLVSRGAVVPAAAGAYVPPVQPTSAGRSATLIRRIEVAFQPYCGVWLASAARVEDRRLALATLAGTVAEARSWGAATGPWPGWRD